jgi:hypothetical protein
MLACFLDTFINFQSLNCSTFEVNSWSELAVVNIDSIDMILIQVIKPKLARPGRVAVTACAWGLNGKCVGGGLADGSIQVCSCHRIMKIIVWVWNRFFKCLSLYDVTLTQPSILIQVWNVKAGWGSRPDIFMEKAHESGDDVTSICFSADGNTLLSRSTDSTAKVCALLDMMMS